MNYLRKRNYDLFDTDFFKDLFDSPFNRHNLMKTDIRDDEKKYYLDIEVPGIEKENISLSIEEGYLTITASASAETKDNHGSFLRKERHYGSYSRSFYVGEVKKEDITASCTNGILTISVPKENPKTEEKKSIDITWN